MSGAWTNVCVVAVGVLIATPARGGVLRVPADFPSIQAALDVAVASDSVLVAPGTYTNCDGGPCTAHVALLRNGVALVSEAGPDATILRVDTPGGGINMVHGAGIAGVVLSGFTITGTAAGYHGAAFLSCHGILVEDCRFLDLAGGVQDGAGLFTNSSTVTVRDCEFIGCVATAAAAGYRSLAGSAVVEGCLFEACGNGAVGLVGLTTSSAVVRNCVFQGTTGNAALEVLEMPTAEISGNVFVGNSSPLNASALVVTDEDAHATLRGNLFVANIATGSGTPTVAWAASGEIRENTFWGNTALRGSGIRHVSSSGVTLTSNNIFVGNMGSPAYWVNFTQPQGSCNDFWSNPGGNYFGYVPSPTDLFVDPLLCDPVGADFHLMKGSPCLPENSGVCGLIGAFGQGCGPVPVEPASWGKLKAAYR